MATLSSFLTELKRRRVFRVAAFYGGIAFAIIQIIDGALDNGIGNSGWGR